MYKWQAKRQKSVIKNPEGERKKWTSSNIKNEKIDLKPTSNYIKFKCAKYSNFKKIIRVFQIFKPNYILLLETTKKYKSTEHLKLKGWEKRYHEEHLRER